MSLAHRSRISASKCLPLISAADQFDSMNASGEDEDSMLKDMLTALLQHV